MMVVLSTLRQTISVIQMNFEHCVAMEYCTTVPTKALKYAGWQGLCAGANLYYTAVKVRTEKQLSIYRIRLKKICISQGSAKA